MRKKTIMKMLTMFLTFSLLTGGSAMTAFAYGNGEESTEQTESSASTETVTVSEDGGSWKSDDIGETEPESKDSAALARDDDSLDVEWNIVEKKDPDGDGILTPVGNLTLVDDLDEQEAENLQYMTVKTKSGNVFYLIVDRSGDENNVYFLNMVDESDLMALMDEETQEKFREATASGSTMENGEESTDTVLFTNQDKEKPEGEADDDKSAKDKKQTGNNPIAMLLIFAVIGAGVAGGYYFFKIKPEKEQPAVDEDMEFYDDEDYVNEDTVNEDQEDENTGDGDASETDGTDMDENAYRPGVDDFSDESIDD